MYYVVVCMIKRGRHSYDENKDLLSKYEIDCDWLDEKLRMGSLGWNILGWNA